MTALLLVLTPILVLYAILSGITLFIDMRERRIHQEHLDVRAWREKVDAMRRMHDEEGAA